MDKAGQIKEQLRRDVESIRNDPRFTDEAKRVQLARAYRDAKREMTKLRTAQADSAQQEREQLERRLFGIDRFVNLSNPHESRATLAVSYRDAQDRAARLDQDGALGLIGRAVRSGDEILARVVLERAVEQNWIDVLNAYAERNPGSEPDLQRLVDLNALEATGAARTTSRYARQSVTVELLHALDKPAEIAGLADDQIDQLVAAQPLGAGAA
jgi:hypothetical protein